MVELVAEHVEAPMRFQNKKQKNGKITKKRSLYRSQPGR